MVMDLTTPNYSKGDIIKIKGKSLPFKITDIFEEDNKTLYLVKQIQEYIIEEDQITKLIKQSK
jgi:hypothetical protein